MTAGNGRSRLKARSSRGQRGLRVLACLVILSLTFVVGVLVGRQSARSHPQQADWERGKRAALANRGELEDREVGRQSQIQEKLTFYHTLTAPLASPPGTRASGAGGPVPKLRDAKTGAAEAESGREDAAKSEVQASTGAPESRTPAWTVQVAAFRSLEPAEALQRALAASGYDAHVTPSTGEEGTARYRVRVGSYPSRSEAEKVVERLRAGFRAKGAAVPGTQERASTRAPEALVPFVVSR